MTRFPLVVGLLAIATACPVGPGPVCTDEFVYSTTINLEDESGGAISGADLTYTVDGGDSQDCEDWGDGSYVCGGEESGEFVITIRAMGYAEDTITATLEADECHVIPQSFERTLESVDCTAVVVTGVHVTVTDGQGLDVTEGDVQWEQPNGDQGFEDCFHLGGNEWSCAEEHAGLISISIENPTGPYESFQENVEVDHDGCHPITENLDAVLQYLPD